jgi:hypothetical protein
MFPPEPQSLSLGLDRVYGSHPWRYTESLRVSVLERAIDVDTRVTLMAPNTTELARISQTLRNSTFLSCVIRAV